MSFKVGDVVQFKSGGPHSVVTAILDGGLEITSYSYETGGYRTHGPIPADFLVKVEEQ